MRQDPFILERVNKNQQLEVRNEISLKGDTITLHPLTMRIFNSHGVYFPSKLRPKKVISYEDFLSKYADYPIKMRVCFDEVPSSTTMLFRSKLITAYGLGLDGCYIVISDKAENVP